MQAWMVDHRSSAVAEERNGFGRFFCVLVAWVSSKLCVLTLWLAGMRAAAKQWKRCRQDEAVARVCLLFDCQVCCWQSSGCAYLLAGRYAVGTRSAAKQSSRCGGGREFGIGMGVSLVPIGSR